ncbi:MAG: DEAD/DEAH box helicase [Gemmataceae bacterium]|nr:DEAD/DEAH box helicase [Gemmata sp.]MDW8196544.1 DEAD/DEAH box helicase [Gemmataceae bacterium]
MEPTPTVDELTSHRPPADAPPPTRSELTLPESPALLALPPVETSTRPVPAIDLPVAEPTGMTADDFAQVGVPAIDLPAAETTAPGGQESPNTQPSLAETSCASAAPPETNPTRTFAELQLMRPLLEAIAYAGYQHPTPIQEAVIPPALRGHDVIGQAQTGTGKTAAFLLPFLHRWRPHQLRGPIGLVMTPTRELALQITTEAEKLAPSRRFRCVAVYGGTGLQRQRLALAQGCDLVVGTPGRVLDLLQRGSLTLAHVRYVVLDEADRMLDIGFRDDIERILRRCPPQRQTLLMSATVPEPIKRLVHRYMKNPVHLHMTPEKLTVDKIRQSYFTVDPDKKFELLQRVIEREQPRQCLIFVERKRWADNLYRDLKRVVAKTAVIHGDLPQSQREKIMAAFRSGQIQYLIATDVMSRGIDVSNLSHVINYDLPTDIENYVHRIGRTGRIGKDGIAISFVTPDQGELLTNIERMINRLIEEDHIEGFVAVEPRKPSPASDVQVLFTPEQLAELSHTDDGWGWDDDNPAAEPLAAETERKPVFGRPKKRYSQRL